MMPVDNLTDRYGRIHNYLRISLTEQCNLRCSYCMPEDYDPKSMPSKYMRADEIKEIADLFVKLGIRKIRLTGGEPLIRKDAEKIIRELGQLPVELTITTNGILIDKFIDVFRGSGIRSVNVSLDSLKHNRQTQIAGRNYFNRIISNIDQLLRQDFHVKINMVVMKGVNDDELVPFIEWTQHTPVHVRFIEFMPFYGNKWQLEKGVYFSEMFESIENAFGPDNIVRLSDQPNDTAKNYRIADYKGTFAIISAVTNPFCETCNRIRLTADGKIKNCLFANNEMDLLSTLRKGISIDPLIRYSILTKRARRGGHTSLENFSGMSSDQRHRSMVSIGG